MAMTNSGRNIKKYMSSVLVDTAQASMLAAEQLAHKMFCSQCPQLAWQAAAQQTLQLCN